ncbi:MAG: aminopeptidase C [Akkermansiaceae bacterium]
MSVSQLLPSTANGSLTPDFLTGLREGYTMGESDRACHNAVTNNAIESLALNRNVLSSDDGHFSHRVKSKGIMNQQKSGRCWMFAAMNVMRPQVVRDHDMDGFQFSHAYLQFWDKLEKANMYLESIIELRDVDFLDREWEFINRMALEDGGWWNYAASLVEKYGVVPVSVMPETFSSENTQTLNHILERLLRVWAIRIVEKNNQRAGEEALRNEKEEALKEVYRFLVLNLGEPPTEFEWRYKRSEQDKDSDVHANTAEVSKLTSAETYTPKSFYKKYVNLPLSEYVCLYHDPNNELNQHYSFKRAHNIVGKEDMHFVNVAPAAMKEIAVASILANQPLWFAVDMTFDHSLKHGLFQHQLYDYEALFGLDLSVSKGDRLRLHTGIAGHAMALMGVDLDKNGQPKKWLVENSWGEDKGNKGIWTMHNDWFDEHVYTIIAHKRHVSQDILDCFKNKPTELPCWYPASEIS